MVLGPLAGSLRRIRVDARIFLLCDHHAGMIKAAGVKTVAELFALFPEQSGKRALVSRRAALDRRVFPARPEGRRKSPGRRAADTA
jgi:hypothetical protein